MHQHNVVQELLQPRERNYKHLLVELRRTYYDGLRLVRSGTKPEKCAMICLTESLSDRHGVEK